jgi:hypothetical protein
MNFLFGVLVGYAACRFGGQKIEDWIRSKTS